MFVQTAYDLRGVRGLDWQQWGQTPEAEALLQNPRVSRAPCPTSLQTF